MKVEELFSVDSEEFEIAECILQYMSTNPQSHIPFSRWNIRGYVKHSLYSALRESKLGRAVNPTDSELATRIAMGNSLEEVYHKVDAIIDKLVEMGYAESHRSRKTPDGRIQYPYEESGGLPFDGGFVNDDFVVLKPDVRKKLRENIVKIE